MLPLGLAGGVDPAIQVTVYFVVPKVKQVQR